MGYEKKMDCRKAGLRDGSLPAKATDELLLVSVWGK